ncbi:MAG: gamma-glutamyltransferase [Phycisphaerales bacterium]|nr:gamma-glutamyltransferase [Phycisphaerales bacterium]
MSGAAALSATVLLSTNVYSLDRSVVGLSGMVVTGHPLAAQTGLKVLQAGGTACDAAIATATVLSITMTDMMGPAGSGYALLWDAQKKELSAIDYNGVAPAATDPKQYDMAKKLRGPMAPTVPGALKGWEAVHKKCGSKPWAELWQDAINYAENGWPVDTESNFHIKRHIADLGIYDTWVKEFLVNNDAPGAGYLLKRKDLAQSYQAFAAQGSDALYKGEVGDKIVAYLKKDGGLITKEDLLKYEVKWTQPIQTTYRGYTVYGNAPSSSSITWMQILNILEDYDLKSLGHNSPEYLHRFIEATKYAYADGYRYNGDPAFVKVPVDQLLSKDYAAKLREKITDQAWGFKPAQQTWLHLPQKGTATSHMTIVDKWGNAVSMTNTLGTFFGSGVVAEGTGLVLSNGMDWFDIDVNIWTGEKPGALVMAPGKRNRWTLAPGMIFRDDKLFMVVGGAGAEATMWGIAQPIVNAIDFGMDPQAALYAPRFRYGDIYHYTGGTEVWLEPGINPATREALLQKGHKMSPPDKPRIAARGTTQMIIIDQKTGAMLGGAAPQGRDNLTAY